MLILPSRIEVRLKDVRDRPLALPDILVGINFLVDGRYYYGNLVGLTDQHGIAAVQRDDLERRFQIDRVRFPMDYKVPLERCDSIIELLVMTGDEVARARQSIVADYAISPDIREAYDRARNCEVAPALVRVQLTIADGHGLQIGLVTGPL
jgi:hypothetical protein